MGVARRQYCTGFCCSCWVSRFMYGFAVETNNWIDPFLSWFTMQPTSMRLYRRINLRRRHPKVQVVCLEYLILPLRDVRQQLAGRERGS